MFVHVCVCMCMYLSLVCLCAHVYVIAYKQMYVGIYLHVFCIYLYMFGWGWGRVVDFLILFILFSLIHCFVSFFWLCSHVFFMRKLLKKKRILNYNCLNLFTLNKEKHQVLSFVFRVSFSLSLPFFFFYISLSLSCIFLL